MFWKKAFLLFMLNKCFRTLSNPNHNYYSQFTAQKGNRHFIVHGDPCQVPVTMTLVDSNHSC